MTLKSHEKFEEELTHGFKNDMTNLVNIYQSTQTSENFHFPGLLLSKVYIMFVLKKYRGEMFYNNEEWCEIWKIKLTFGLENDMGNFVKFHQNTWKCLNWKESFVKFLQNSWKCLNWNFDGILLESDARFQEELTCKFIIDMRNLTNFDPSTQKSQKFAL